jgi:hypothetical protein
MAERLARGNHLVTARRCSHGAVRRSGHPALNDANAPQGHGYNICLERVYSVAFELNARCNWLQRILVIAVRVRVIVVI